MTRARGAVLALLVFCLTTGAGRAQSPRPMQTWAILFPTVRFGDYDLCLAQVPAGEPALDARLTGLHAEVRDEGTRRTQAARVTPLPAPLPVPGYGPLDRVPGRAWAGLHWDTAGLPPGMYTLSVSLPGDVRPASLQIYLPDDAGGLRAARAGFLGRRVWPRAALWLFGPSGAFQFGPRTSLRVRSITRLTQPSADLAMNSGRGPGWDISPADFLTRDPLRVVFDRPRHLSLTAYSFRGAKPAPLPAAFVQDFADPWQMTRALGLRPPPRRLTPPKPGASPARTLAWYGWPTEYGTFAQLAGRSSWRYNTLKPFYAAVYFKRGKFVRFDPGGSLP